MDAELDPEENHVREEDPRIKNADCQDLLGID